MEGACWNPKEKVKNANDYYLQGKYYESMQCAEEGLSIFKKMRDMYGQAQACQVLAWSYYMVRDYEQSGKYGDRFLNITREVGHRKQEAEACMFLACLFHMRKDFDQSKINGNQALRIAEELKDDKLQARAHHVLSKTCFMVADPDNTAIELGDSVLEGGACLGILAPLYHESDRVTRSFQNIEYDDQSLNNGVKGGEPKPGSFEVLAQSHHPKEAMNRTPEAISPILWLPYGDNVHSHIAGKDLLRT